jgi:tRNA (cmo5U34)-methyltransferase
VEKESNPENMAGFFDARAEGYDEHMAENVDDFEGFYKAVAEPVYVTEREVYVLDLGAGTGLELAPIFHRAPNARVTVVDLSSGMLQRLQSKYAEYRDQLQVILGSYLDLRFEEAGYDYVVSVMTMHHLLQSQKCTLYRKICRTLRPGGRYIEGDWVVPVEEEERRLELHREISKDAPQAVTGALHVDIPFSLSTQMQLLRDAGFESVETVRHVGEAAVYLATP